MNTQKAVKPKRQKKKKSRTEVFSSDSESDTGKATSKAAPKAPEEKSPSPSEPREMNEAEISAAFTKYYMTRATTEFAEDLDKIRGADDFNDDALPLLINALQQGTEGFSSEEMRRVVTVGIEKKSGD